MGDVFLAIARSIGSLARGRVWGYILAPAVFSLVLWVGLAFWGLSAIVDWLVANPPLNLFVGWGWIWLAHFMAYVGGWLFIFALAYLTTSVLAAVFVLPWLLDHVARTEYPEVSRLGTDSFTLAVANSVVATTLFVLGWLLSLPFWLLPGLSILLPLLLMAWFNRRTFGFDAACLHATPEEWRTLRTQYASPLFLLGLLMAILAHVPLVGLLVPAFAALAYVHLCLELLRRHRGAAVIVGEARRVDDDVLEHLP